MFIETCEVFVNGDYDAIDEDFCVPHMFYAGDEVEIESIEAVEHTNLERELVRVVFADGKDCFLNDAYFIRL